MPPGVGPPAAATRTRSHRLHAPILRPLLVLALLASAFLPSAPAIRPIASTLAYKPWCLVDDPNVPDEAYAVEEFARTHNYSPPPGLKGNSDFFDVRHDLPALLRPYKEYDVFPPIRGAGRRTERVILSIASPTPVGTPNHYDNFILMFPLGCLYDRSRVLP
jgi:hypothetical protein